MCRCGQPAGAPVSPYRRCPVGRGRAARRRSVGGPARQLLPPACGRGRRPCRPAASGAAAARRPDHPPRAGPVELPGCVHTCGRAPVASHGTPLCEPRSGAFVPCRTGPAVPGRDRTRGVDGRSHDTLSARPGGGCRSRPPAAVAAHVHRHHSRRWADQRATVLWARAGCQMATVLGAIVRSMTSSTPVRTSSRSVSSRTDRPKSSMTCWAT